jgi:hypothetical protein
MVCPPGSPCSARASSSRNPTREGLRETSVGHCIGRTSITSTRDD